MQHINFYCNKVATNVLAKDIINVREIYDTAEGHAAIGILSAQFSSVEEGVLEVKCWVNDIPSISVGLGAGDLVQYYKVVITASQVHPTHVNQTLTGCGFAAGISAVTGGERTHINALVSPIGTPGDMLISTGVSSSQGTPARVPCDATIRMMLDPGTHTAKSFPMGGKQPLSELYVLATTAVRNSMTLIEPTGGIDLDNFGVILQSCLGAGVPYVTPHVYSSIIDPQTGNTWPADVIGLMEVVRALM